MYFKDKEIILYMATDLGDKQLLEDGLNRTLRTVTSLDSLIENVEILNNQTGEVSLIVTSKLPTEIRAEIDKVAKVMDSSKQSYIHIYEIGVKGYFQRSMKFATINTFIEYARDNRRQTKIKEYQTSESQQQREQADLMQEILNELRGFKEKTKDLEAEVNRIKNERDEANAQRQKMKNEIDNVWKIDVENKAYLLDEKEKALEEQERVNNLIQRQLKDVEYEMSELRKKIVDYKYEVESYQRFIENKDETIRDLKEQINNLNRTLDKERRDVEEMLLNKVDSEDLYTLRKALTKERDKNNELTRNYETAQVQLKTDKLVIEDLEQEIDNLRRGEVTIDTIGRSITLDQCVLKGTNVYYFKFIKDLPYVLSQIQLFAEHLRQQSDNSVHIMTLRNNEGIDRELYQGKSIYAYISDVLVDDTDYLLYPSSKMFTGYDSYDGKVKHLIVLDYIRSNEYYIKSEAVYRVMTVAQRGTDLKRYELAGLPITLDTDSVMDVVYDSRIRETTMKEVREKILLQKLNRFIDEINI